MIRSCRILGLVPSGQGWSLLQREATPEPRTQGVRRCDALGWPRQDRYVRASHFAAGPRQIRAGGAVFADTAASWARPELSCKTTPRVNLVGSYGRGGPDMEAERGAVRGTNRSPGGPLKPLSRFPQPPTYA